MVLSAADGRGGVATKAFVLVVADPAPANHPPVIVSTPPTAYMLGSGGAVAGPASIVLNVVVRDSATATRTSSTASPA